MWEKVMKSFTGLILLSALLLITRVRRRPEHSRTNAIIRP
jgi:hypothetical protein